MVGKMIFDLDVDNLDDYVKLIKLFEEVDVIL